MSSIIIAVLYQACFSESSIGIISTGLYFILAGIFLQRTNKIEAVYEKIDKYYIEKEKLLM